MSTIKQKIRIYLNSVLLIAISLIACCSPCYGTQTDLEGQKKLAGQRYEDHIWEGFLNSERDKEVYPKRVIKFLALKNGDVVADIGAGSGYFTFRLARAVGPQGVVYAVDIQPEGLAYIQRRITDRDLNPYNNIYCIVNKPYDVCLQDASLDLAFLSDVHFYRFGILTRMNEEMIRSIYEAVKPGGRLAVIEKRERDGHYTSESIIRKNFERAGFKFIRSYKFMKTSFFLLFKKN